MRVSLSEPSSAINACSISYTNKNLALFSFVQARLLHLDMHIDIVKALKPNHHYDTGKIYVASELM